MRTFRSRLLLPRLAPRILALVATVAVLTLPTSKAAAASVDTHMPFSFVAFNPCTGEGFTGSGFSHVKFTFQFTPNFHISVEENVESAQGVTASGVRYVAPEQTSFHVIIDSDSAPVNQTVEEMLQFIRQAEDGSLLMGDDSYVRMKVHATVNANGDLTVFFSDFTMTCR